jgi:uncharacterized protein YdhG (YjbR/CyaY superfamily)
MKKTKSGGRGSTAKRRMPKDMDAYLARVPEPARTTLNIVRGMIRSIVPSDTTEGISYGIPAFKYKGGLVAFAAFKNHCSFFPMGASVLDAFKKDLKDFRVSKGTLHFPLDKPLPASLLKKIVRARIAQNESKRER